MGLLHARVSGVWEETDMAGSARVGGSWIEYGPSGGLPETLFTVQVPAVSGSDGAPGIVTATTIHSAVDGVFTAVRFYAKGSTGGTYTGNIWQVTNVDTGNGGTGTLLATKTYAGTPVADSWNTITLDTPVTVTAGTLYRVGIHNPTRYVATNLFFSSPLTNGNLTADAATTSRYQGSFNINASSTAYPNQIGSNASYFVDAIFVAD